VTYQDLEHRLERVEAQHSDYISVLSSHTAAIAGHTATMATLVAQMSAMVGEMAALRQDVTGRLDRLETFLRSKLNGGGADDR
jgi:uncharacterized coiled-coil protein SlyX